MKKVQNGVSAVILAGGCSSRMGSCKAELPWEGKTLIEHQVNKMLMLGIEDIVISGYSVPIKGTRFVPDIFPLKGPLGGIHAGLMAAKNPHCLVTGVDTPLVPLDVFSELIDRHVGTLSGITLLTHGENIEPTIGMYESRLADIAEKILMTDNTSIRVLLGEVGYLKYRFTGDETLLCDCNTPEELEEAVRITKCLT